MLPVIRQPGLIYSSHQLSLTGTIFEVDRFCSLLGNSRCKTWLANSKRITYKSGISGDFYQIIF